MKTLLLALTLISIPAFAFNEGTDRGNGGDEYGKSFINYGLDVAEALAQNPIPGVDALKLQQAVQGTFVNSQERLELRGNEVDAINYPDSDKPRIIVSRASWDRMEAAPHRRAFLVLHEYLGIMGIDDSRYQISGALDRAGVCERPTGVREAIEEAVRKSCYRIIQDDLKFISQLKLSNAGKIALSAADFSGLTRLQLLWVTGTEIISVDDSTFGNLPKIQSINFLDAMDSLDNCDFLRSAPDVSTLLFTLGRNSGQPMKPLKNIASHCFRGLKNLKSLRLAFDAAQLQNSSFLEGLVGDSDLTLELAVENIGALNSNVFLPVRDRLKSLVITAAGTGSIPPELELKVKASMRKYLCQTNFYGIGEDAISILRCDR